ncbi:PTS glucitol/sorbitol transporter subunit IIC [Verminephrobacter eiseniae]|uniref:PTS glucitol/sorbitol transporter subunit IIC n=1 Tax=Verminephrobacter eiseniae TaxID=364317 RepID=UPI0010DE4B8F|nr:PTS glucitol/sorbitol transporter subunit IIC [Verminephrobacter eiseniae]KAB7604166.1 PTS sorbitol transporter subunit IIC [Verminephrobacter sp. Larva24]MCW5230023.1 PTS sorbitol transporter subunit IIC [Verminephrobacter eiseniae]MCW5263356.1 PTS sorbitol transporter subunit IIC [Verminephrobacter eiseniae]MCW5291755.1 PTS sorbitol transporter subunit IIC [Verminephrobacter eiseniae]MCW8186278.1 PTS sorbitol transporter subunit IIC [Verminephrobacter eiseniae]
METFEFLARGAEAFIGVFNAGGKTFVGFVTGILPTLIVLLTAVYTVIGLVGEQRVHRLARFAAGNVLTRYTVLPLLAMFFLTNPMAYTFGMFVQEKHKPAFYDSAVSLCHPITGLFPHANPGELFVWLGVAAAITKLAEAGNAPFSLAKLALAYLLVGLFVNLLKGIVTEWITTLIARREGVDI